MVIANTFPNWLQGYVDDNLFLSAELRAHIRELWPGLTRLVQNRVSLLLIQLYTLQNTIITALWERQPEFQRNFPFFRQKQITKQLAQQERQLLEQEEALLDDILSLLT